MSDKELESFNLVGGTTLSLKVGHRKSVDIDLFTDVDFDAHQISCHLAQTCNAENIKTLKNGIFCFINGIKVDILAYQYPLVNKVEKVDGIRMLSLQDIGAMKLKAIFHSGITITENLLSLVKFAFTVLNSLVNCIHYVTLCVQFINCVIYFWVNTVG